MAQPLWQPISRQGLGRMLCKSVVMISSNIRDMTSAVMEYRPSRLEQGACYAAKLYW